MCGNEASWIWSMERKALSFDHMLTSARDSRFQACIHILVESILLIGLADRLKTRVYIRTWYPGGKSQRVEATSTCEKLCCAHRPVPEIKGCRRDHDLDKCVNHGARILQNPLWGYVLTVSYESRRHSHESKPLTLRNNTWNKERWSSQVSSAASERQTWFP